jgi:hypothetical protein
LIRLGSGWFLNKLSIDDPIREITYEIPCNAWLSTKSNDQKTMRDFQVASWISHKKHIDSDGMKIVLVNRKKISSEFCKVYWKIILFSNENERVLTLKTYISIFYIRFKTNLIIFLEHQEENDSQVGSSSTTTEGTSNTSSTTNPSQDDQSTGHKRTKNQQRVSIGPTTVAKKRTSLSAITNHLSQPPPATTVESHFNRNEFAPPPVPARRIRSPVISSSDDEIENNVMTHNRSITPTTSPTLDQSPLRFTSDHNTSQTTNGLHDHHSIDDNRPPARLEKRSPPPISLSPERPIKTKQETNEDDEHSFFD